MKKRFGKYFPAVGCFVKTILLLTVMITTMLPVSWYYSLCSSFTWSTSAIHLRSSLASLSRLKFWFAKKLKINLRIAATGKSFCKLLRPCKKSRCFKRWCNCLISWKSCCSHDWLINTLRRNAGKQQLKIIFQSGSIRDYSLSKSAFIRRNSTALSKFSIFS